MQAIMTMQHGMAIANISQSTIEFCLCEWLPKYLIIEGFESSLKNFESLILQFPNDSKLQRALASEHVRQKRYSDAIIAFDLSII